MEQQALEMEEDDFQSHGGKWFFNRTKKISKKSRAAEVRPLVLLSLNVFNALHESYSETFCECIHRLIQAD